VTIVSAAHHDDHIVVFGQPVRRRFIGFDDAEQHEIGPDEIGAYFDPGIGQPCHHVLRGGRRCGQQHDHSRKHGVARSDDRAHDCLFHPPITV
jgi:hypothetical protein